MIDIRCLPDDIIEVIFISLFKRWRVSDANRFSRVCKNFHERFMDILENQCKKFHNIYIWLHENTTISGLIKKAKSDNRIDVVEWIENIARDRTITFEKILDCSFACIWKSDVPIKNWFESNNFKLSAVNRATKAGRLDVLIWIYEHRGLIGYFDGETSNIAAYSGHLEILKWLQQKNQHINIIPSIVDRAASGGHLDCIKWLYSQGYKATGYGIAWASNSGYLNCVKWLYENKVQPQQTLDHVARYGHLETVKFLHEIGVRCTDFAMDWAAENGHLECIKFLHSISAPCLYTAIDKAIINNHLDVAKYLHEHRIVGFTRRAIEWARENPSKETAIWLKDLYGETTLKLTYR